MAQVKYKIEDDEDDKDDRKTEIEGYNLERRDPYGMWWVVDPQHKLFKSAFTSLDEFRKALAQYKTLPQAKPKVA